MGIPKYEMNMAWHKAVGIQFQSFFFSAMINTGSQHPKIFLSYKNIQPIYRGKAYKVSGRRIPEFVFSAHADLKIQNNAFYSEPCSGTAPVTDER